LQLAALDARQCRSLAGTPFLLFSLGEGGGRLWQRAFLGKVDLLDRPTQRRWVPFTTAAIAFLWHLSRRDPYCARLFSGASRAWCTQLADCCLVSVTEQALKVGVSPVPRPLASVGSWDMLITAAASERPETAVTARIAALQTVLMDRRRPSGSLAAAACRVSARARQLPG
jgi:hypothetical protein